LDNSRASDSALPASVPSSVTAWPPASARFAIPLAMLPVPTIVRDAKAGAPAAAGERA
jgi:hypothetical protein